MVASSVVLTVVVLNYHHRTAETHVMPMWVRSVFLQWLPWILRMSRPGRQNAKKIRKINSTLHQLETETHCLVSNGILLPENLRWDSLLFSLLFISLFLWLVWVNIIAIQKDSEQLILNSCFFVNFFLGLTHTQERDRSCMFRKTQFIASTTMGNQYLPAKVFDLDDHRINATCNNINQELQNILR